MFGTKHKFTRKNCITRVIIVQVVADAPDWAQLRDAGVE